VLYNGILNYLFYLKQTIGINLLRNDAIMELPWVTLY